jgi:putative flippase GtrA
MQRLKHMHRAIDTSEFVRFVATGITATVGNISGVWFALYFFPFEISLAIGVTCGFLISFALSKLVAFRSRSWDRAPGEIGRFLVVYAAGVIIYWGVGLFVARHLLPGLLEAKIAEIGGALVGASTMTFTSYLGHRFFTYRTFRA